ncbi:MAG: HAMP domain-containing protein [bacterium]|nr:HAMP domain-containing protein [bacterium]
MPPSNSLHSWDKTTIRAKLIFLLLFIGMTPIAVMGTAAYWRAKTTLEDAATNQLTILRETKKAQVEDYFTRIEQQIITLSKDLMTLEAMMAFSQGYHQLENLPPPEYRQNKEEWDQALAGHYKNLVEKTPGVSLDSYLQWMPSSPASRILQYMYIVENPDQADRAAMKEAPYDVLYNHHHLRFHPQFADYAKRFDYYDLFLIEADSGVVVYSTAKECDFGADLKTGAFSDGPLARAFERACALPSPDDVVFIDFERYGPSGNIPAAFIASPIYDGERLAGVLAFQLSIEKINEMMTIMGQWEEAGLGRTGQVYIVSHDGTLRNDVRGLVENKDRYLDLLRRAGAPVSQIEMIDRTNTSVLTPLLAKDIAQSSVSGTSGVAVFRDERGEAQIGAYSPLDVPGLDWYILAVMNQNEAFRLANQIGRGILINLGLVLLIVFVLGWPIIRAISFSIQLVTRELADLASGEADLSRRIPERCSGEMGAFASHFNRLMDNLTNMVTQVQRVGVQVTTSTTQIAASARQLETTVAEQASSTNEVVATAKEISATSRELVNTMNEVGELGNRNVQLAETGRHGLNGIDETMHRLVKATGSFSAKLSAINDKANNINSIITTITKVADQTNLLSLNAAIEAEKAGEYGQGFSVVAREIRRLADQAAVATLDIEKMVREMLSAVSAGVMEMDKFSKEVTHGVGEVSEISGQLSEIIQTVEEIRPRFTNVLEGMNLQSQGAQQITQAMVQLSEGAEQIANSLKEFNNATAQLNEASQRLQHEFSRFKMKEH